MKPKLLLLVICHNRPNCMMDWLRAWKQCDRENATLYIVCNGSIPKPDLPPDARWLHMPNQGLDIGALQRFIVNPPESYDLLMWTPDDFLAMRSDFIDLYREPFADPAVGMVGTFWGGWHIRSGGVCIRRDVAEKFRFPPGLQSGSWEEWRHACWLWEGLKNWQEDHEYNFLGQVTEMGRKVLMVDGTTPPDSPHWRGFYQMFTLWDRGWQSQDLWNLFTLVFPEW